MGGCKCVGHYDSIGIPWQVQVSILGAHAAVKTYAFACSKEGSSSASDSFVLLPLLAPHTKLLGRCWVGLLRDYTAIRTQWATKIQVMGMNHVGIQINVPPSWSSMCRR